MLVSHRRHRNLECTKILLWEVANGHSRQVLLQPPGFREVPQVLDKELGHEFVACSDAMQSLLITALLQLAAPDCSPADASSTLTDQNVALDEPESVREVHYRDFGEIDRSPTDVPVPQVRSRPGTGSRLC